MRLHSFSEFAKGESLVSGEKIKIDDVLEKEIIVHGYMVSDSKFKPNEKCLKIGIELNHLNRVIFTGSKILLKQCEKYKDKMPFKTKLVKVNKHYAFS